jgi:hypothetical protein
VHRVGFVTCTQPPPFKFFPIHQCNILWLTALYESKHMSIDQVHLTYKQQQNPTTRLSDWVMYIVKAIVWKLPNPIFSIPDWSWLRSVGAPSRKSSEGCRVCDFPPRLRLSSNVERLVRIPPGRYRIMSDMSQKLSSPKQSILSKTICAGGRTWGNEIRSYKVETKTLKANSHTPCHSHGVPLPCHATLIHTCDAKPLPFSDSAVSFVKVHVIARNIRTASPTV